MSVTRRGLAVLTSLSLAGALAACSSADSTDQAGTTLTAGAVSAQDWAGNTVSLEAPAVRVVCLDGTCVDAMAELGVTPVASTQPDIIADPRFFDGDDSITPVGGTFMEPNVEEVIAAEPDLVVGSASVHASLADSLGDIPLYLHAFAPEQAGENLQRLGDLTGHRDEADRAVTRWQATLESYGPKVRQTTVLSLYGGATKDVGIDASDSGIGQVLGRYTAYPWPAGGEDDAGFLEMNLEEIAAVDPEHIWVLDFGFDPEAPALVDTLSEDPVWGTLSAVKSGHVHQAPKGWWGAAYGTRAQQLLLDEVMTTVYPDEFPTPLSGL